MAQMGHSAERPTDTGSLSPLRQQNASKIAAESIGKHCQATSQRKPPIITVLIQENPLWTEHHLSLDII